MLLGRYYKNTASSVYNCLVPSVQNHFRYNKCTLMQIILNSAKPSAYNLNYNYIITKKYFTNKKIKQYNNSIDENKYNHEEFKKNVIEKDLYPFTTDQLLISIKSIENFEEIFKHYEEFKIQYSVQNYTQVLQKITLYNKISPLSNSQLSNELKLFLESINNCVKDMNIDEVMCSLICINQLGISSDNFCNNLLTKTSELFKAEETVPLPMLFKFTNILRQDNKVCPHHIYSEILSHILSYINSCNNSKDLYLITCCLQNLTILVEKKIFKLYLEKVEELLVLDAFNNSCVKELLKIANFLSNPIYSSDNKNMNKKFLSILSNKIETMNINEIENTFKLFHNVLEPAVMLPKLLNIAKKNRMNNKSLELLSYIAIYDQIDRKKIYEEGKKVLTEYLSAPILNSNEILSLYKLIRSLKISDITICDMYWSKILKDIIAIRTNDLTLFIKLGFYYMYFNNNLGGTFRHLEFEKVFGELAIKIIIENEYENNLTTFSRLAGFIIAYGTNNDKGFTIIPEVIITKLEEVEDKLNSFECAQIAQGLKIASELRYKFKTPKQTVPQLKKIDIIMKKCIKRYLENENIDLINLNNNFKILNNCKVPNTSTLFTKTIQHYEETYPNINSRIIRDLSFNLQSSNYLVPNIVTECFDYIDKNKDHILGDTVEKVLNTAYGLAYIPEKDDALYSSADIIKRDFDYMTAISILNCCISLCFYRVLSVDLVAKLFTPEFINRIEDEIELCYSKYTYPQKILNKLMQLNRAVCLDYPELQVPWFQQNYIEAQMSKAPIIKSKLSNEVENILLSILKNKEQLLVNFTTPYGYRIDFVVNLNYSHKLLNSNYSVTDNTMRFAILLLKGDAYCKNNSDNIKGQELLRVRHLEMLGFNVIHINVSDWNAMHMNIPGAKVTFLKKLLKLS